MEIKLIAGATAYEAAINTIEKIDTKDMDFQNIVVVPDSFSMQAESLIFDVLKIKSTFNIEVVGISRLANKILRNNNIQLKRISGLEEVFAIFNVVKECEDKFVYFKKCGMDFCLNLLQIIKQFKGCKIEPEKIKPVGDESLDAKLQDLKMIYQCYEEKLADKNDLSKLLEYFVEKAENELNLSKIRLFFINFDSFSTEINSFICKLAKFVSQVFIGYARPISVGNAYIYEDDILRKTTQLAKQHGVLVDVEIVPTRLQDERLTIVKNLFSFNVEEGKSDFFTAISAKNPQDEIDFVAKYIKYQIVKGKRFKNFAIAVSDKKYFSQTEQTFSKYGITSYCDEATDLSKTLIAQAVLKVLNLAKEGFSFVTACSVPYLFEIDHVQRAEELEKIRYLNLDNVKDFLQEFSKYKWICDLVEEVKTSQTIDAFVSVLNKFVDCYSPIYQQHINMIDEDLNYKVSSENKQALELLKKVLEKLVELGGDHKIVLADFQTLFEMCLKNVKVETIPSYIDAVYVGDATESYFHDVDILFVLGATASSLPKVRNDTGIIDDNDIAKMKINYVLEPEIKVLNRRARLKLFEVLQHAQRKLFISIPVQQDGKQTQPAGFVIDLTKMFGKNIVNTISTQDILLGGLDNDGKVNKLLFNLGNASTLALAYAQLERRRELSTDVSANIRKTITLPEDKNIDFLNKENVDVLLPNKRVSASQLETYFCCPFKHFVSYGLKIKPFENCEPNKKQFGIFQHAVLEKFIKTFGDISDVTDEQVTKFLKTNVQDIAKQIYDEKVLNKKYFSKYLQNECKIILKNVIFEQKVSNFRPKLLEEKIFEKFHKDINLVGFVDRTDTCENYFRILDYKTGKTEGLKKDLYYGKKLQLFLYADAIRNKLGLDCAGVYYFNCQTKYSKSGSSVTILSGITKKDNNVVINTDKTLWEENIKSRLIGASLKKNVKPNEFSYKNGNTVESFDHLFEYAKDVSKNAIDEMKQGYVKAKPLKDECQFCPYISICRHQKNENVRTTQIIKEEQIKGKRE